MSSDEGGVSARSLLAAANSLAVDDCAAEVAGALADHGVRGVLLKGASIARWLYGEHELRPCVDVDLLVAPETLDAAGGVLCDLGYAPGRRGQLHLLAPGAATGGEVSSHAMEWERPWSPPVDLHNKLHGVQASPERCWKVLSSHTTLMVLGGATVEVLAPVALALHIVLHAVSSGIANAKAMDDLARVLDRLSLGEWQAVMELAAELDALPGFGNGLRLVPAGQEVAEALGVPEELSVELVLRASSERAQTLPFEHVAAARGVMAKTAIVARVLVPTPAFVRLWYPEASPRGGGLVAGYLYRLWWVARHAPRGLRSWYSARRRVAAGRGVRADPHAGNGVADRWATGQPPSQR